MEIITTKIIQEAYGYGDSPPAIGFDFVGGPLADENDGIDNNFNGIIDEAGERLRIDYSVYFNNTAHPVNGNLYSPNHYYNYLQGLWLNNTEITYGGNGTDPDGIPVMMMFPGDSDPLLINTNGIPVEPWSEITEGNPPGDRRQVISSGPFSMAPNEHKVFTLAIPWAREEGCEGVPCSLDLLREADDLAQELHNNCYELPCMVLETQFEIIIENGQAFFSSNITSGEEYHWTFGDGTQLTTTTPFASHHYEFAADIEVYLEIDFGCGSSQSCQRIGGLLSDLMIGPELTQIEGTGNTNHFFELTEETVAAILENDSNMVLHPTYKKGKGPVKVLVHNIDAIQEGDYTLQFDGTDADAHWKMFMQGSNDTIYSELPIGTPNAQFIEEWGLMVSVDAHLSETESAAIGSALKYEDETIPWLNHVQDVDDFTYQNWIREGTYQLPCKGEGPENCFYLDELQTIPDYCLFNDFPSSSEDESFEQMINGGWAPGFFVNKRYCQPFFDAGSIPGEDPTYHPGQIRNVDLIFTSDKSLWTRCPVLDLRYGENVATSLLREVLSVDKYGRNQTHPDCDVDEATYYGQQVDESGMSYGMGWFPGYAIDVNTGKRLNLLFGENSNLIEDNGNDMIWNPTPTMWNEDGNVNFGGSHSISILSNHNYPTQGEITDPAYDGGQAIYDAPAEIMRTTLARRQQQWTGLPLLNEGFELLPIEEGLIPTKTTIQLRLRHRYQNYLPDDININNGNPLYNFTIDYEDLISEVKEIKSPNILLFPNPARDILNVQLADVDPGIHTARIFNLNGQLILEESLDSLTINAINISGLSGGVYILRLGNQKSQSVYYARFVVVR